VRTERGPAILADRYALQVLLDRFEAGMVWLATDTVLDRTVTVTLVDPRVTRDDAVRERLFANARTLATAAPKRLVRLLDAGMDGEVPYLVTERVSGESLAEILERDGPLPPRRAASIVAEVLAGIEEARAVGVASPDARASNVIVDEQGRVRIRDTGVASAVLARSPADAVGTSRDADPAFEDVRAAGELLVELLTARPFERDEARRDEARLDAPRSIRTIVSRSTTAEPTHRYPDGASMAAALREAARDGEERPVGGSVERPAVFRTWVAVPLVVVAVAAALLGAGLWLGRIEIGGPGLIRLPEEPGSEPPVQQAIPIAAISVVDPPPGDGTENDDRLPDAIDGDPSTVWRSENYFDGRLNKPGMGLVLDLGRERTVTGFRLSTPNPGFTFSVLVGDDPATTIENAPEATTYAAPESERGLEPRTGRYVVVWITSVVALSDGTHRATVSDVRIFGTS
jgi:serine/threonine protein kinase